MDENVEDFIKSDYALEVCRPYVKAQLRTYDFFINAPHSIKMKYWEHMHEMVAAVIRQKIHEDFHLHYDILCAMVDVNFINKLNPKLFDKDAYG